MGEDDYSWLMDLYPDSGWTSGYDVPSMDTGGVDLGSITGGHSLGGNPSDVSGDPSAVAGVDTGTYSGTSGGFNVGGAGAGASLLRSLGFTNPDGSLNWAALLGTIAPIAGGLYAANRTNTASSQMQDAIKNANATATSLLGNNQALYQPYRDAGMIGLNRLTSMAPSNLAARYKPLGAGNGFSLGTLAKG